jgi:hypothetical protein
MLHFIRNGLDEIPRYDYQKALENSGYVVGRSARNIENTKDFVDYFTNAIRPLVKDLPKQVKETFRDYHQKFGKGNLTEEQLDWHAANTLQLFWAKVAKGIGEVASD